MGRIREKPQILFKNSNNTFNTYSKTCSAFSEAVTKSIILQLRKNIQNNNYYDDKGTLKRDLSVETDICILRRYVKENKSKINNKHSSMARFKYSMNNADQDAPEESNADNSACGDSQRKLENAQLKVDLTTLVVDNLKTLLNDWIKKYLLENDKTKQKIATVLDSLLHKVELEQTSSSGTYTLDVEVINETRTTNSITLNENNHKICFKRFSDRKLSSQTVPLTGKRVKLISTLSVPKISTKTMKLKNNRTYIKYHKGSINKLLSTSSSCNILEIKTESLTKRCATYQNLKWEKNSAQKLFGFIQQPTPEASSKFSNVNQSSNLMKQSLLREKIIESFNKMDKGTSHQSFQSKKQTTMNSQYKCKVNKRHLITYPIIKGIKRKYFVYRSKKQDQETQKHELLKNIRDLLKYFERSDCINDLRFDIQINISPDIHRKMSNKSTNNICDKKREDENNATLMCSIKPNQEKLNINIDNKSDNLSVPSRYKYKIIPLLDGALSQAQYLISQKDIIDVPSKAIQNQEPLLKHQETSTSRIEIFQEISEIRKIIKDLVSVADHMAKENKCKGVEMDINNSVTSKIIQKSIAIQCVTTETKNAIISGLNIKKESKKKETQDLNINPRVAKRSTSYRIIESESVLQIHDLTARPKRNNKNVLEKLDHNEPKTKSQSLSEVPLTNHNRKVFAFYCDKCIKSRQCIYNTCNHNVPYANMYPNCECDYHGNFRQIKVEPCPNFNYTDGCQTVECNIGNCCMMPEKNCIDAEAEAENSDSQSEMDRICDKKFVVSKRSVGFKEGCFYCILLWIPVLVIMWLFYVYILKAYIESKRSSLRSPLPLTAKNNTSIYAVSLTDLGF